MNPRRVRRDSADTVHGGDFVTSASMTFRKALLVIVTYNSYDALPDVVETIRDFEAEHPDNHVVVVENSSDPRVSDFINTNVKSDRIFVDEAPLNIGFSHGVNRGYELAQDLWGNFDFVVLLNPDVISAGRVVCELVDRAVADSDSCVGIWSAVLRDERGKIDRGCARRVWNRRRLFSHLVGYHGMTGFLHTAPWSLSEREIWNGQNELAMVSGALMCIAAGVLEDGLDTLLPMYLEDQEICMRNVARGGRVRLYPDLELVHVGAVSRKSVTEHERALRVMELVEAPVQCMSKMQGYGLVSLRMTVLLGGICRYFAAPIAAAFKMLFRHSQFDREVGWISEQQQLAKWFMLWAITGDVHTGEVTLSEYFQEYSAD
jgi:GT2 family glycosyltransferase